jgi:hypothetical protein
MKKKTLVVNFFAGPGTGKSTFCAGTFAALKWGDVDCEMALEYAKDLTWESSSTDKKKKKVKNPKLENQLYVFGKQQHRIFRLNGKVDVIVTDSPLLHSLVYDTGDNKALESLILEEHSMYDNLNIFLRRKKKYNPNGRSQTLQQAIELDNNIKHMLDMHSGGYEIIDAVPRNIKMVVKLIRKRLKIK